MSFERTLGKLAKCLYLYLAETPHCGIGVFAARSFAEGEVVIQDLDGDYYRDALSYDQLQRSGYDIERYSSQVDVDRYVLPNGNLDDYMNHCCEPNTGMRLLSLGYQVIALREIRPHDEVTYDYSTYLSGARETFACRCGASACRGQIGDFVDLPEARQRHYLSWDVVGRFAARPRREELKAGE